MGTVCWTARSGRHQAQGLIAGGADLGKSWIEALDEFLRLEAYVPGVGFAAEDDELEVKCRRVGRRLRSCGGCQFGLADGQ